MNTDADAAERETRAHSSASPDAQQKNKIPLVENERGVCKGKLLAGLMNSETESASTDSTNCKAAPPPPMPRLIHFYQPSSMSMCALLGFCLTIEKKRIAVLQLIYLKRREEGGEEESH